MKKAIHPEFAELLEKTNNLSDEELEEADRQNREQRKNFRSWVDPILRPRVASALLLKGWKFADDPKRVCRYVLDHPLNRLRVIISGRSYSDGRRWLHLSLSHRDRLPSWDELKAVKSHFFGDDVVAIQVFPPKDQWVNVHPNCLHLWRCVDADPIPDFRLFVGSIASI